MVYDLVIRGGTVFDGTGRDGFEADIAIEGDKIAAVGKVSSRGRSEISAKGQIVTPGFVDIHTHYDGQATWDCRLWPSSQHGVTTVLMGNCGVGFAPCRPGDQDTLVRLMEGVEDIPGVVLNEGLDWKWESFAQFLDALDRIPHDIDFATQVPHAPVRVYAMGERGANREPATAEDIAVMARLVQTGVEAGALGFSTSRTLNHRSSDGHPTPTLIAEEDELLGMALALKAAGRGVMQIVSDLRHPEQEIGMMRRLVERSGRPLSVSLAQTEGSPQMWRTILQQVENAANAGLPMRAQVIGRPVGVLLGFQLSRCPFSHRPSYAAIDQLAWDKKLAILKDPSFRARLLAEKPDHSEMAFFRTMNRHFGKMFDLGDPPDYEPSPERTLGAEAARRGIDIAELAYDTLLKNEGSGILIFPFLNYAEFSLDSALEMMRHKDTVIGLADGGAHVGTICDSSLPTYMLTHWTRDRSRGEKLPLAWVVKAQSHDTARAVGLTDRGTLEAGRKADLNVIDYDRLTLRPPRVAFDLPKGGRRLLQDAEGYTATIVSGQVVYRNAEPTCALPGRLVRGRA